MKAICKNGLVIDCGNFKAIDGGVVLTKDKKRKKNNGFVPMAELKYIVPDGAVPDDPDEDTELRTEVSGPPPVQRQDIAAVHDRLDRLEAAVQLSREDVADRSAESHPSEPAEPEPVEPTTNDGGARPVDEYSEDEDAVERWAERTEASDLSSEAETQEVPESESARAEGSGFDPVAVMAEQAEHEEASSSAEPTERGESDDDTDADSNSTETGALEVGGVDPVATVARQEAASEDESGGERADEEGPRAKPEPESEPELESTVDAEAESEAETDSRGDDLQRIDGLGPTYATRLRDDGVESLNDLRESDVETVAAAADVGEARAENWIEAAQEL